LRERPEVQGLLPEGDMTKRRVSIQALYPKSFRDSCVHTPGDGRGMRKVLVNGVEIDRVVYAHTRKGKVIQFVRRNGKFVSDKHGKRVRTRTIHGHVQVLNIAEIPADSRDLLSRGTQGCMSRDEGRET
jgi:hypothetical protein